MGNLFNIQRRQLKRFAVIFDRTEFLVGQFQGNRAARPTFIESRRKFGGRAPSRPAPSAMN